VIKADRGPSTCPRGFGSRARALRRALREARRQHPNLSASQFWSKVRPQLQGDALALAAVFHHKCAYCESRMLHVQRPHIEHYRPKGRAEFEKLMFAWDNWLLSCGRCNDSKWGHFPICAGGVPCLIDPTKDDPNDHVGFAHEHVSGITPRGTETLRMLGLDRGPLEDERARWLHHVDLLLLLAIAPLKLAEARDLLVWCVQDEAPWTACTRAYLASRAPKLLLADRVHILGDPVQRIAMLLDSRQNELDLLR
jgi:uncharacterized protein (TIGR02646 family)